ncbi:hypothetical protein CEP52_013342 [Fusarium oligoseptatum]|uniref:NACHT domain-containing protein n=1 Tax=Fusarium oligoseptatum TaxID=2604345 RepID=A0A428SU37_9HYPO|nr:hypothetical protein CEP52_013342 [Fusarium oligoseptatum]
MAASAARIYDLALQSEQDLEKLQMLFASKNDDQSRLIQRQRERFQHWAGHLGVFAVPQASLDHRLENAPQTRDLILQLLRTLEKNIQHAFKSGFTTGDENPQPEKSVLYQYSFASQLAESVSFRRQRLEHQVRHEKILNQRRDPEQDMQEQTEELPKVGSEPELETLQQASNPNQSQRIVQDHGLASEKKGPSRFPQAGPSSVTEPSEFKEPRQEQLLEYIGLTRKQSGPRTETSMNPSMLYPPTPKTADTEAYYKCAWCSKQIPVPEDMTKWRLDWRAHFNEDLEPYVCISEECSAQPVYFSSRRNWQAHMNESHTVDWSQEIHKNAIWYCDLDPHGYQEFMDAEELRNHLKSKHEGTVTSEESETLVAMNTMYVSRSPTECPLCFEDILNLVENEPIPAKPAANREFPDLLNNSAETKPGYQASHDHLDSDEEGDETYLVATAPQTSEEHGSELSNRMKMMIHVGRHLKSLSFMSLRYFEDSDEEDDEKGSAKSYKVALGARAERSSQEQHGDHYFELEDSLTFEDVSPDQRFLFEEEDEVYIGKHKGETNDPFSGTILSWPAGNHYEWARGEKKMEILRRLHVSPYLDRKERNPYRIPGTCDWFVSHELFRDWQESKSSKLLWVSADPGCGKSVLMKYLVDSVLPTTESRTVCYFFFKDDFEDQRSVVAALCCILRQLFIQKSVLLSDAVVNRLETNETLLSSFDGLWQTLIRAAEDKNAGEIVCLLDAIDECEDQGWSRLAEALRELYGTERNFNLKFLLTSRPYSRIRHDLQPLHIPGLQMIHLSADLEMQKISREIDIFIKVRLQDICARLPLTQSEKDHLLRQLTRVPNRTYLWVHHTLDSIETSTSRHDTEIVDPCSQTLVTVGAAYERILSKSRDPKIAKKILHIIVAAARPLTTTEMNLAIHLGGYHRSYDDLDLRPEEGVNTYLREMCGLFVTIIDSRIYLLHETAKEFLVRDETMNYPIGVRRDIEWKHSLPLRESHRILAEICIRHLLLADFEEHPLNGNGSLSQYVKHHVFLDYSAKHWAAHLRELQIETQKHNDGLDTENL